MKKIKLATRDKSRKCSHSKCGKPSVIEAVFGNESRKLCQQHYNELANKNIPPVVTNETFVKASKL